MAAPWSSLLLSCSFAILYRALCKDCSPDEIGMVMISCQDERTSLSLASNENDTSILCGALQKYSECIGPKIVNCQGQDQLAFNIIKTKYSAAPYYCRITETWKDRKGDDQHFLNDADEDSIHNDDNENHIVSQPPLEGLDATEAVTIKIKSSGNAPPSEVKTETDAENVSSKDTDGQSSNAHAYKFRQPCLYCLISAAVSTSAFLYCQLKTLN